MGRGQIRYLKEAQARSGADMADTIAKWRDLAYKQSETMRRLEARIEELESIIDTLKASA